LSGRVAQVCRPRQRRAHTGARGAAAILSVAVVAASCARPVPSLDEVADRLSRARSDASREATLAAADALWAVGQRSSALERYLQVAQEGRDELGRAAVARLAAEPTFPLSSAVMDRLASASRAAAVDAGLERRVALHLLRRGDLAGAARHLGRLAESAEAQYLLGVVRLGQALRPKAYAPLWRAVELARSRPSGSHVDTAELARLALARLAADDGHLAEAIELYGAVPYGSPHFARARQELAWVLLQAKRPALALAQSAVLRAPAARLAYRPDAELVEATALFGLCRIDEARTRARAAERRLTDTGAQLAVFLRPRPDVRLYYVEATASVAGKDRALSAELAAALLGDASFRRVFMVVRQLQDERARLLGPESASLRRELSSELDARLVAAQTLAGQAVQRLLVGLLAELRELRLRAAELLVDVESVATRAVLERAKPHGHAAGHDAASRRHHTWPFAGEYWSDEVSHLTVRLEPASSCP
jgi:hypothetical protein